jgi:ubiquinone biosynthesis protein COQ9
VSPRPRGKFQRAPLIFPCQVRQLAAVELRKRISVGDGKLWKKTPQQLREQIKQSLLERLTQETS